MQPNNIWFTLLDADLPTPTKSVGMTLMKRAAPNTNQVNLSMPDFLTLTGCGNEQAAKRHLIRLKQAGFIHYSTCSEGNLNVFITFLMEETGTQITQMNADLELGALHFPKCVAPHDGDTSESDGTQDARHLESATHLALSAQVEALQTQVGQLQGMINLLCQRLGVEVEAKIEVEMKGEPRVGFGALAQDGVPDPARHQPHFGAPTDHRAPDSARGRAHSGASRRYFRREAPQQTDVSLFVHTPPISGDLTNKPTPVSQNAPDLARKEESDPQISQMTQIEENGTRMDTDCIHGFGDESGALHFPKCVAPRDEETNESNRVQDARHSPSATRQSESKKSAQSVKSVDQSSSSSIPLTEQDHTFKLLTDPEIGISQREARKFAQSRSFDYVRCQVFAWQKEMVDGTVHGTGALVNRIRSGFGAPQPSKVQQESELYQRHRTPFEVEAEEKVKEELRVRMAERDATRSQPQPEPQAIPLQPVDPAIWQQTLALLHKDFRGSSIFDRYVAPTRLLGVHEGVYVISVVNQEMLSQTSKMRGALRRHLGMVLGENVSIRLEITRMSREQGIFRAGEFVGSLEQVYGAGWHGG